TQTDSLALEQKRGITIKSAVASFTVGDLKINLIDTPGHPDFIAEVERALGVLDAVILVISAVEGVQPQTRILAQTLKNMRIPVVIFVKKSVRRGVREADLRDQSRKKLFPNIVDINTVANSGSRSAGVTGHSDIPAFYTAIAAQTRRAELYPVFFGSAITGVG